MTTVDREAEALQQCPVTHFHEVNKPTADGGWHFANFDAKREEAPVHQGKAGDYDYFLITRMADIRANFQNPKVFSSTAVVPADPDPPYMWIPEMLDGQQHTAWRQLLGPLFSPAAIAALEPQVRKRFGEILDDVAPRGQCDFVQDVGLVFPNTIFMDIMGLPREDAASFQKWETDILHTGYGGDADVAQLQYAAMMDVTAYFSELIQERRKDPRTDLLSIAVGWEIDGKPIPDDDMLAFCLLMFMAGLDTVAAQLAYSFWHLAKHPDDRRRLVDDPSLIPGAIEEFLRYYSFVTPGRKVLQDTEVAGCPIKAGQMVYMPIAAANRDPREFDDADRVIIDRQANRHIAFGAGPHRCLGSHLARQELRVGLEMWHQRIPDYSLLEGAEVSEHGGQIGLDHLHLVWPT
jgi:cytochrome P450